MSREILLRYAKGDSIDPKYICSYEITTGKIVIHSCCVVPGLEHSLFVRVVNTKEDLAIETSDEERQAAIDEYYKRTNT